MNELAFLPAHELARRIRRKGVSALELLELYLARIERLDRAIRAVPVLDAERALERARQADAALAHGEPWGPLHGVPMTVKESFNVAGLPTTWGYESLRDNRPERDALTVARLKDAGAVILGKTNVPVYLADWQTFNPVYGTTCNPWDLARTPGGSSGGSAAALAAGLSALELGSDIGASIRNPAHYCGVYGHKPTWGVVSLEGQQMRPVPCIDHTDIGVAGPLARSAFDLEIALDVLASPLSAMTPLGRVPMAWRTRGTAPRRCRVAVLLDDALAEVDASVQQALRDLVAFLRAQGVVVREQARPVDSRETHHTYIHLLRASTGAAINEAGYAQAFERAKGYTADDASYAAWHHRGMTLSHRDWVRIDQVRAKLRRQWDVFFEQYDFLICPTATTPAFERNERGERWERLIPVNGRPQPTTDALFWAGYPGVVGLPATAVPLGLSPQGLPIGAQIVAPAFGDLDGLRFAQWLEREYRAFVPPPMAAD
ncbi:MAG: amidase [Burkholderiaceae bacterium]|nr:amidase [Burkholderiaceae bacterium]